MIEHGRRDQALAALLAALAGFVDATGFIATGGLFLSFMSGNSTRLAVGLAAPAHATALAGGVLAAFVAGVTVATLLGQRGGGRRRRVQLLLVAGLLALAALLAGAGLVAPACLLAAAAMGAENTVFEAGGDVRISLTFMTGNLVKIGQRLALALSGGPAWHWLPYALLWSAMLGVAVTGALLWPLLELASLWVAAAVAVVSAALVGRSV